MSLIIKSKSNLVISIIFVALFLLLHFYIYVGVQSEAYSYNPQEFNTIDFFTIPPPYDWEKIEVREVAHPSYLNPFRKWEYAYSEIGKSEIVLIMRDQANYFNDIYWDICQYLDLDFMCEYHFLNDELWDEAEAFGNSSDYFDSEVDPLFGSGWFGGKHANRLFFLIQYLVLLTFIYNIYKAAAFDKK